MKNRDASIDMLRGIAIVLVVFGHVIQSIYSPDSYDQNWIFKVIYSFHMPLFMFISGYLAGYKKELTVNWLLNRAVRLVVPFVVWIPISYLIKGGRTLKGLAVAFYQVYRDPSDGGLWFLWVLFLCCVILFVIENINAKIYQCFLKNKVRFSDFKELGVEFIFVLIELMLFAVLWSITGFTTTLGFRLCCKEIIFFISGYYVCKYIQANKERKLSSNRRWQILFYILFPFMVIFWDRLHFVTFYDVLDQWIGTNSVLRLIILPLEVAYYYVVSFMGIGFVWNLTKSIRNKTVTNILKNIGRYTIEIYILHTYFFINCFNNKLMNTILSLLLGIILPFLLGKLVERQKQLSLLLFGK